MGYFDRFDKTIEKRNWDHLKYIQRLTMSLILVILVIYVWIIIGALQGYFSIEFVQIQLKSITIALISGIISGLVIGFIELSKYYFTKNWDLHTVVPAFFMFHLIITTIVMIILYIFFKGNIWTSAFIIGFVQGGLISMIAYAGEIKIEHSDK